MIKLYLSVFILFCTISSFSQSLAPTVISTTGGFASSPNGSLSYTVGEMSMIQTFRGGNNILTQGFQQPNDNVTGLLEVTHDEFGSFVIYPNPAVDNVWFGVVFPESGRLNVSLYNDLGQKMADVMDGNYDTGKTMDQINLSGYASGMYVLSVNFVSDKDGKTHLESKKFQVIN
jgi:hypothetical protein